MKKDKLKIYLFIILLIIILSLALFVSNIINKKILALILIAYAIITLKVIKKKTKHSLYDKQLVYLMLGFAIVYVSTFYVMGFYFGYYKAPATFSLSTIINFILPLTAIVISSELIRGKYIHQKGKYINFLVFIAMVLIDLIVYTGVYSLHYLEDVMAVIGFILFASISCNLLYNYIAKRYGVKGIIFYRLITVLYVYFIPIIPNVYIFFRSFLRMIYPYLIYIILEYTYSKTNYAVEYKDKKKNIITTTVVVITMSLLIMLVSCNFRFGALVVGSGSMTGTINKGDVIIFESYKDCDPEELKEGTVIVFYHNGVETVHRIVGIERINGEVRYYTKGDANQKNDDGYSLQDDVVGIVRLKVKYIGYPTIWLNDLFS